ncbi:bacteriorhodopsin [Oculatella sp. LEGE 06141]|uniref:bacteriorhodopsin n=1 Tax=Oculatella sp. LEGE 06141 TaxID=1828648 RepID=UPI001881C474|nr:bacteriorhodopsin [Oculatella sp. LEGE 06141]MBE9181683.1 bacteriorhodopsin [Oculatella sp. LEGE 06141]
MRLFRKLLPIAAVPFFSLLFSTIGRAQTAPLLSASEYPDGLNFENILAYSPLQHDIISHVLTLGYAAQAAGLVYFLATLSNIAPRYRLSSVLSAVVMSSAFLELFQLSQNWNDAFVFTDGVWQLGTEAFSNGFRYMNWSIDVPMLLLQLVVVLGLTRRRAVSYGTQFIIGGLLMIWTGYIGQFYEVTNLTQFWIWGAISTVFYIYVLFVIGQMINTSADALPNQPDNLPKAMRNVFWYILLTWTLYPIAYLIPVLLPTAWGAVIRQIIYTTADISSKVIYGAILSYIARKRSEDLAYEPAISTARR